MSDFVAYHSHDVMGYDYTPGDWAFYSNKPLTFLQSAIGGRVWVITGRRDDGRHMVYRLAGAYTPSEIHSEMDRHIVFGERGIPITPPVEIGAHSWFARLLDEQNNFSYGFSRIRDESIVTELQRVLDEHQTHAA